MKHFLNSKGFTFPMMMGNPRQLIVKKYEEFEHLFNLWNGKHSCFMSSNGTPSWRVYNYRDRNGRKRRKLLATSIDLNHVFFDLDSKDNISLAWEDSKKIYEWCEDKGFHSTINFTGGKGFQVFIHLKPKLYRFVIEDGTRQVLERFYRGVINWFKDELELQTVDNCSIEPKKLCRIPTSKHVNRKGDISDTYCMNLDVGDMFIKDVNEILKFSKEKQKLYMAYKDLTGDLNLIDFIFEFNIDINKIEQTHKFVEYERVDMESEVWVVIDEICNRYPCVSYHLKTTNNPLHKVRIAFCLICKSRNMNPDEVDDLWVQMGKDRSFVDLPNSEYRRMMIDNLYNEPRYNKPPNCMKLMNEYCICIKDKCPHYEEGWTGIPYEEWRKKNGKNILDRSGNTKKDRND